MTPPASTSSSCCCHNGKVPAPSPSEKSIHNPLQATRKTARALPSMLLSILIAFFPKCPVCWAVYMSMFGSLGLAKLPYMRWLLPVLLVFLALHLFLLYRKAAQRGYLPFMVSLAGAVLIVAGRYFLPAEQWLLFTGMGLIISGSLLNSLTFIRLPFTAHSSAQHSNIHH